MGSKLKPEGDLKLLMKPLKSLFNSIAAKAIALLVMFIVAYWVPLKTMAGRWWTDDDYSYGFFIPVVSMYLFWDNRKALKGIFFANAWSVLPVLILSVLLSLYGILGSSGNIAMPIIPILVILFAAFCFGTSITKRFFLPLAFLIFMVPVPDIVERYLGLFLKSVSTRAGAWMIEFLNIPVHVSGNVIDLGVSQLQVVDACSGMRGLFALLALGVIYAYFFEEASWKRIVSVLATMPIAVAANALRIGITGILTERYGGAMAEGFFHGFSGWILFVVAFAFLFAIGRILRFFPPKPSSASRRVRDAQSDQEASHRTGAESNINRGFVICLAILALVGLATLSTKALPPIKIRGDLKSFPLVFSCWQGRSEPVDPEMIVQSGAEEAFSGIYGSDGYGAVSLYLGYRSTAFLSDENFFHSPTVCLPSSGWTAPQTSTHIIGNVPRFKRLVVTEMVIANAGTRQLVYFWFQTKDQETPDKNVNRFHLALHALKRDNTHDLFIRPIALIGPGEKIEDTEKRMDKFVCDMMAALFTFLQERQFEGK